MLQPRFSIITVCKNEEKTIEKTILSILNQTYKNYELIIIDGKSTDRTLEIIEKYKDKISVVISEKDTGIYSAMNKGINNSKGKYLNFMNAGDYFYDNYCLEKVSKEIDKNNSVEILFGNSEFKNGSKLVYASDFSTWHNCYDIIKKHPLYHQAMYFKRELFDTFGLYEEDYKIISDVLFYTKCLIKKAKTKYINEKLAINSCGGISEVNKVVSKKERKILYKRYFPYYSKILSIVQIFKHACPKLYNLLLKKQMEKIEEKYEFNFI